MHRLFLAEFKRAWIEFKRYPAESVTGVVTFTAVFLGLFLGAKYMAGGATAHFGMRLDAIIVGYLLWSFTIIAFGAISYTVLTESQTGTLEQVYLSPFGPIKVFLVRAIAGLAFQMALIFGVLVVILLITQRRLHMTVAVIPPVLTVIIASYGLGFLLGGLALLFKRIGNVLNVSQFALIFLVMTPVESWTGNAKIGGYMLPLVPSAGMIRDIMARGKPFDMGDFVIALGNALVYFALGMLLFSLADRYARSKGVIGGY